MTSTSEIVPATLTIDSRLIESVAFVYIGKKDRCACGCSGKYSYAEQHRAWASKNRGYKVDDDEVRDRTVKLVFNKIKKATNVDVTLGPTTYMKITAGDRWYIAYLKV